MIHWTLKKFDDLSPLELHNILQLRSEVFVVEQQCIFQDIDGKDPKCYHIMGQEDNVLLAYTRLVPPGISYAEPAIGRVVTSISARNRGAGRALMEYSIQQCHAIFGRQDIRIGAQLYLQKFYTSLGFRQSSEIYLEDGIQHIEMILS
ncbi:MAG: GNAT family N-acetyltransferase [Bacteroidetes bacterium]|nr:GNAT family N-acetyltransferase [Bacteroidota bacterium]